MFVSGHAKYEDSIQNSIRLSKDQQLPFIWYQEPVILSKNTSPLTILILSPVLEHPVHNSCLSSSLNGREQVRTYAPTLKNLSRTATSRRVYFDLQIKTQNLKIWSGWE